MSKSSILSHPTNDYFSRCFTWQVAMCEGNICAAHILNYMEYTSNAFLETIEKNGSANKRKENPLKHQSDKRAIELDANGMPIIPLSYSELTKELIYQFGRNQIIDAMHYLIDEEYLLPVDITKNSTDKVLYYSLSLAPIKHFIEFWEVLTPYRKSIMEALINLKNNKRKKESTVYFQTVHSLILNDARFNIKLSKVYYQTMESLILNDVYNVLRLIKTLFRTNLERESEKEFSQPLPPISEIQNLEVKHPDEVNDDLTNGIKGEKENENEGAAVIVKFEQNYEPLPEPAKKPIIDSRKKTTFDNPIQLTDFLRSEVFNKESNEQYCNGLKNSYNVAKIKFNSEVYEKTILQFSLHQFSNLSEKQIVQFSIDELFSKVCQWVIREGNYQASKQTGSNLTFQKQPEKIVQNTGTDLKAFLKTLNAYR